MRRRPAPTVQAVPFAFSKAYSFGPPEICLAVVGVWDGVFALEFRLGEQQVASFAVKREEFERASSQFKILDLPVQQVFAALKAKALSHGATLEAIQLMGAFAPLTKQEEASMAATKLQKADTTAIKSAAKETPVGGKKTAPKAVAAKGGKTSSDNLAKAREAKGPAPNRKYTVVNKTNGGREGSWTHHMVGVILKNKDTDSAKAALAADGSEYADRRLDFSWAEAKGYIKF